MTEQKNAANRTGRKTVSKTSATSTLEETPVVDDAASEKLVTPDVKKPVKKSSETKAFASRRIWPD